MSISQTILIHSPFVESASRAIDAADNIVRAYEMNMGVASPFDVAPCVRTQMTRMSKHADPTLTVVAPAKVWQHTDRKRRRSETDYDASFRSKTQAKEPSVFASASNAPR